MPHYFPSKTDLALQNHRTVGADDASNGSIAFRTIFGVMLVFVAIIFSASSYFLLHAEELKLFESQYHSIASEAVSSATERSTRMKMITKSAAIVYKYAFPDKDMWPNVAYQGFYELSDALAEISSLQGQKLAFFPIIRPENAEQFESFVAEWLENDPLVPPNTGMHSFGRGIFAVNNSLNSSDHRYHDVSGQTDYGSHHRIMAPLFQAQGIQLVHRGILYNAHSDASRGLLQDSILECVQVQRKINQPSGAQTGTKLSQKPLFGDALSEKTPEEEEEDACAPGSCSAAGSEGIEALGAEMSDNVYEQIDSQHIGEIAVAGVTTDVESKGASSAEVVSVADVTTDVESKGASSAEAVSVAQSFHGRADIEPSKKHEQVFQFASNRCSAVTGIIDLEHIAAEARQGATQTSSSATAETNPATSTTTTATGAAAYTTVTTVRSQVAQLVGAQTAMYHPIFPANKPDEVVGFSGIIFHWKTMLNKIVPEVVTGIDIVIETPAKSVSYEIRNGQAVYKGHGDLHDPAFSSYRRQQPLFVDNAVAVSTNYSISVYPNAAFKMQYVTDKPTWVGLGALMLVVLTSLVFLAYDFTVKQEVSAKQAVLDTKRRFVRFISHEVRTPLNTVKLGMQVLVEEQFAALERLLAICSACSLSINDGPISSHPVHASCTAMSPASESSLSTFVAEMRECVENWLEISRDVLGNSEVAVVVLDDLLNYDKIEMGTMRLEFELVRIWELIKSVESHFRLNAKAKNVELQLKVQRHMLVRSMSCSMDAIDQQSQRGIQVPRSPRAIDQQSQHGIQVPRSPRAIDQQSQRGIQVPRSPRLGAPDREGIVEDVLNTDRDHALLGKLLVLGDRNRLAQVLRNLVSNALKFTPNYGTVTMSGEWLCDGLPDLEGLNKEGFPVTSTSQKPTSPRSAATAVAAATANANACTSSESSHGPDTAKHMLKGFKRAGSIVISVTDTGAGLSEEQLVSTFGEGVQFNAGKLQAGGGSGLGLFITKGLVEQHGGRIWVSSEGLGKGSTFSIELPLYMAVDAKSDLSFGTPTTHSSSRLSSSLAAATAGTAAAPGFCPIDASAAPSVAPSAAATDATSSCPTDASASTSAASNVTASSNTVAPSQQISPVISAKRTSRFAALFPRILLVDDAASNRKMLRRLLTAKGFSCEEAVDGTDALKMFARHRAQGDNFSTILMDFEMPEMNGPTATKELRTKLDCTCPIFGVTGNALLQDVEYFKQQGANKVLPKPLNINALEQAWEEFIDQK